MTQDSEVGDGTTSVTVLAAELLKEAERLIAMRIHPQTIIAGYRRALAIAQDALRASAVKSDDVKSDLLKVFLYLLESFRGKRCMTHENM